MTTTTARSTICNRAARRKQRAHLTPMQRAELDAQLRIEARKRASASLRVSDAAVMQALRKATPQARRFVSGLILHVFGVGGTDKAVFEDACRAVGDKRVSWRAIEELHACGILRWDAEGNHVLHRVLSSTGQQWARIAAPDGLAEIDRSGANDMAHENTHNVIELVSEKHG
ncbi:hypothetical protein [Ruegeria atlantica]|uniref:hypothetical protein n=1 Tax=Ruegeria atlantica TaxID=81569 RepID=UPI0014810C7B|nr:hypothetical protein [Ruegeria atlantica]